MTRATRGYWNHKISPRYKVQVFTKTEKKAVSREIMLIEVWFLSYSVVENVVQFFFLQPHDCVLAITWPLLTRSEYAHKFITQLPKDYYLIPGKLHHKTC